MLPAIIKMAMRFLVGHQINIIFILTTKHVVKKHAKILKLTLIFI